MKEFTTCKFGGGVSAPGPAAHCRGDPAAARRGTTPVFATDDLLAIGLMDGLLRAGVAVPQETFVVGSDDIAWASSAAVPLMTI